MTDCETRTFNFKDDGSIPNNRLPLVYFSQCMPDDASEIRQTLNSNNWGGIWVNGIYDYHHYHSTAHEFIGVLQGSATLQLGGENGATVDVKKGDVIIIPAGVGHRLVQADAKFKVIAAYPDGQKWDLRKGDPDDRPEVLENIRNVPLPTSDPLHGETGPLLQFWA